MSRRYLTAARQRELEGQLSERDLAVLQHVSDLRFVSGSQLTRLCFSGQPTTGWPTPGRPAGRCCDWCASACLPGCRARLAASGLARLASSTTWA